MHESRSAPKKLKLAFAMGGGVSLGAFSGAALTEALKLLLVDGRDDTGQKYDTIELDCISGASAGAISLCIMISCLMNYKRYVSSEPNPPPNKFFIEDIDRSLANQFGEDWKSRLADNTEALRALEVAQALQERIWVDNVTMKELMRIEHFRPDDKEGFSILDQDLLLELVQDFILTDIRKINNEPSHILAKDRLLFACSITNLSPLLLGNIEGKEVPIEPLVRELRKAYSSYNHKELRVFDFQLNANKKPPSKLPKAIVIDGEDPANGFPLDDPATWAMISATCIACGAFPFAFQPVPLRRYGYEYYEEPKRHRPYRAKERDSEFEISFDPEQDDQMDNIPIFQSDFRQKYNQTVKNIASTLKVESRSKSELETEKDEEELIFNYIDGGTLNNEPIREAFRLANYIDSRDPGEKDSYDRIVIFVDPIVRTEPVSRNSLDFDKYVVSEKRNNLIIKNNSEFNRLGAFTQKLIRTLRDQGSIKEEHKISTYVSSINLHQKLSELIQSSPFEGSFTPDFLETIHEFMNFQDRNNNDEPISTFDVNDHTFIKNSIQNYLHSNKISKDRNITIRYFYFILMEIDKIRHEKSDYVKSCNLLNEKVDEEYKVCIKKLYYQFVLQAMLDTDGKDPHAMRMAITPVTYSVEPNEKIREFRTVALPGEEFQGFGGFVSREARAFSQTYGQYCAYKALSRGDFRLYYNRVMTDNPDPPQFQELIESDWEKEAQYRTALISQSPLNSQIRADSYWRSIRGNIYSLMKKRIVRSLSVLLKTKTAIGAYAAFLIVLILPWVFHQRAGALGIVIQLLLIVLAIMIGYLIINYQVVKKLKKGFFNHRIESVKIGIERTARTPIITHYRFNGSGSYKKVHKSNNRLIIAIPFYLEREAGQPEFEPMGIEIKFVNHQLISRRFNKVFSKLQNDVDENTKLNFVSFYRRRWFFFKKKVDVMLKTDDLKKIEGIKLIEQHISPLVVAKIIDNTFSEFELLETAKPLEDVILQRYNDLLESD